VFTQERQDALYEITDDPSINMMVVVGGFNSSNTSHLQEIAEHKNIPSFWVDSAARIDVEGNKVRVCVSGRLCYACCMTSGAGCSRVVLHCCSRAVRRMF
jgi:4-hydroxy-3-methylbut-2-enyl diphosphate reductase IspH